MSSPRQHRYGLPWIVATVILMAGILVAHADMNQPKAEQVFSDPQVAALATAGAAGDRARIDKLVTDGVSPDARGDKGVNLLEWALLNHSPEGMDALLDAGADPAGPGIGGDTVMHMAVKSNDTSWLTRLLAHGASPDTVHTVTGEPALSAALLNPDDAAFRRLLEHGANPNLADRLGNTPLHVAAQVHKSACVLALLEAGADPERRNQRGETFQTYVNQAPDNDISDAARAQREKVRAWLRDHGIAILGDGH